MSPNRRRLLSISGVAIAGLSGCINIPSSGGPPDDSASDGNNSESDTNDQVDQEENEDEEEQSLNNDEKLVQSLQGVTDINSYLMSSSGYTSDWAAYSNAIQDALNYFEQLEQMETENLTNSNVDKLVNKLNKCKQVAYQRLDEQYAYHQSWDTYIKNIREDLKSNIRYSEYSILNNKIDEYYKELQDWDSYTEDLYPNTIVDGRPFSLYSAYQFESNNISDDIIFEVTNSIKKDAVLFCGADEVAFDTRPFDIDVSSSSLYGDVRRDYALFNNSNWFVFPDQANLVHYINVHDYGLVDSGYPNGYSAQKRVDPKAVNLNKSDPVGVVIQKFDSSDTASNLYGDITSQANNDGAKTFHGVNYNRFFFIDSEETYYTHLKRVGSYILAVDPLRTPWSRREVNGPDGEESTSVESVLDGTFLDIEDITLE